MEALYIYSQNVDNLCLLRNTSKLEFTLELKELLPLVFLLTCQTFPYLLFKSFWLNWVEEKKKQRKTFTIIIEKREKIQFYYFHRTIAFKSLIVRRIFKRFVKEERRRMRSRSSYCLGHLSLRVKYLKFRTIIIWFIATEEVKDRCNLPKSERILYNLKSKKEIYIDSFVLFFNTKNFIFPFPDVCHNYFEF